MNQQFPIPKESANIIELDNVSFKYFNSEPIFENLNLSIPNNTHTILTGPNGSGKSTLLGLISEFYIHKMEL